MIEWGLGPPSPSGSNKSWKMEHNGSMSGTLLQGEVQGEADPAGGAGGLAGPGKQGGSVSRTVRKRQPEAPERSIFLDSLLFSPIPRIRTFSPSVTRCSLFTALTPPPF